MKKALATAALIASSFLFAPAAAAETLTGTIVKVDAAARTITFRPEKDKEAVLPVDPAVKLDAVKERAKAQITVDAGVVKAIKPDAPRAPGY
jgi:hypothetical protein